MIASDYVQIEEAERFWHRRHAVWRARKAGAEPEDIAHRLGMTTTQVVRMWELASREVRLGEHSPMQRELCTVEVVGYPQLTRALWGRVISDLEYRLKAAKADAKSAQEEIRKLRVRDYVLIARDGHFIGSRRSHFGHRAVMCVWCDGAVHGLPLQSFCAYEGDMVYHTFVVFDDDHEIRLISDWSDDVPPPFNAWCVGGQKLPALPVAASKNGVMGKL